MTDNRNTVQKTSGSWKPVVEGGEGSGAWAGIACYSDGLCLAGFRSDIREGARIRRSTDSGANWSEDLIIDGAESARAYYFARNGSTVLAGGGAGGANSGDVPNIFRSTDNGATWSTVANKATIWKIRDASETTGVYTILHLGNGRFIAGLEGYPGLIIESLDNGKTWKKIFKFGGSSTSVRRLYDMGKGILLAAVIDSGIWYSIDGGQKWEKGIKSPDNVFSIHDAGEDILLAGTVGTKGRRIPVKEVSRKTGDRVGIYGFADISMDIRPFIKVKRKDDYRFTFPQPGSDMAVTATKAEVVTATPQEVHMSADGGKTWDCVAMLTAWSGRTYIRTFVSPADRIVYAFVAADEYSPADRGLTTWRSEDRGKTWLCTENPYSGRHGPLNAVYDAVLAADGTFILGTQPDSVILKGRFPLS